MNILTCDEAEILLNLRLDGLLDEAEATRLDAHLAACPACRAALAGLEALNAGLATLPDAPVPPTVLAGVLARIPAAPAPAPANGLARWRRLLGLGLALEAAAATLLLLLNWSLVQTFAWGLVPTTALDTAGHHLADGISAWVAWFSAQAVLVQTQWQALFDHVSSLTPTSPAPESVAQALVLLAAVLVVWGTGNRILAVATVGPGRRATSNQ